MWHCTFKPRAKTNLPFHKPPLPGIVKAKRKGTNTEVLVSEDHGAPCRVISTWHLLHYPRSQRLLQHLPPSSAGVWRDSFHQLAPPAGTPTVQKAGVGFLAIHRQPSSQSLAGFSTTGTYLPLMALKSRIPSAGPQTWTKSSLDIFSRSAPKRRHAAPFTGHTPPNPTAGLGQSRSSPTLSGH